jgi:hypothetical protein
MKAIQHAMGGILYRTCVQKGSVTWKLTIDGQFPVKISWE